MMTSLGEMVVFEKGEGEPLLLLHGIGAGASSFIWFTIAPELANHYRVIAPDFIGWGESFHPDRPLLFDDYVAQISALGDWIGKPTKVVAQSLTNGFVIKAMMERKLEVQRLVMHAPSGGLDFGMDAFPAEATANFAKIADSPQSKTIYAQIFHQKPAVENWWRGAGFLDSKAVPTDLIEASHYNAKQPNASYSALAFLSGELRYDIVPLLKKVSIPTLMVWGAEEIQINQKIRERLEKVNPEIKIARVDGARSTFEVERPTETLNILLPFLKAKK
ncbi:MAG: alpha/beta hydrolase [Bacteroidota bacterium]